MNKLKRMGIAALSATILLTSSGCRKTTKTNNDETTYETYFENNFISNHDNLEPSEPNIIYDTSLDITIYNNLTNIVKELEIINSTNISKFLKNKNIFINQEYESILNKEIPLLLEYSKEYINAFKNNNELQCSQTLLKFYELSILNSENNMNMFLSGLLNNKRFAGIKPLSEQVYENLECGFIDLNNNYLIKNITNNNNSDIFDALKNAKLNEFSDIGYYPLTTSFKEQVLPNINGLLSIFSENYYAINITNTGSYYILNSNSLINIKLNAINTIIKGMSEKYNLNPNNSELNLMSNGTYYFVNLPSNYIDTIDIEFQEQMDLINIIDSIYSNNYTLEDINKLNEIISNSKENIIKLQKEYK